MQKEWKVEERVGDLMFEGLRLKSLITMRGRGEVKER